MKFKLTLSFVNPRKATVLLHVNGKVSVSDRGKIALVKTVPIQTGCISQQTNLLNVT